MTQNGSGIAMVMVVVRWRLWGGGMFLIQENPADFGTAAWFVEYDHEPPASVADAQEPAEQPVRQPVVLLPPEL